MKTKILKKTKTKLKNSFKLSIQFLAILLLGSQTIYATKTIDQTLDVGAISGAHAVDLSGAFTYTIPIKIPEGTMGMQPNLSLSYSSQSGNGIAGYGWNLSGISAISRVNKTVFYDTEVSAPDLGYDDALALDGKRIFYEPQANITEGGKKVRTYYSKIDDFNRIYTADNSLLQNFTVKTKDGKTIEYGNSSDSKLTTENGSKTLVWYINKVTDRNGNYMTYHYQKFGRQVVLSRIEYTGNTGLAPYTKVNFEYSSADRQDKSNAYVAGSKVENKKLLNKIRILTNGTQHYKSYQLNYTFNHFNYLTEFQEWRTEIHTNGKQRLNSLTFEYGGNEGSSVEVLDFNTNMLFNGLPKSQTDTEKWVYIPGNFDGDGLQDFLGLKVKINKRFPAADEAYYTKVSIFYNNNKKGNSGFIEKDISNVKVNSNFGILHYLTTLTVGKYLKDSNQPVEGTYVLNGDVNGDNIDDIIIYKSSNHIYRYFESVEAGKYRLNSGSSDLQVRENNIARLIDADSDGRLELFVLDAASKQSEKNRFYIKSFDNRVNKYCDNFSMTSSITDLSKWKLYTKDYSGTGQTHLIAKIFGESYNRELSFDILRNSGCGSVSLTQLNTKGLSSPPINSYHIHANRVDFNGDGKEDDLVIIDFIGSNNIHVNINNTLVETNVVLPFGAGNELLTTDLNADGLTDMVKIIKGKPDKVIFYINKGDGSEYTSISRNLTNRFFNDKDTYFEGEEDLTLITDIDGDGIQEFFLKRPDLAAPKVFRLNFDRTNRLLKNVYDSYENQTKVHYTTLSNEDNYTVSSNLVFPYKTVNGAVYVASKVEFSTNVVNQFGSKEYAYEDLTVHLWGKGMLGFTKVTEIDNLNETKTESFFKLDTDKALMLPEKTKTSIKNGNTYSPVAQTTSSYSFGRLTMPGRDWLRLDKTTNFDNTNNTNTVIDYTYDTEGNAKTSSTKIYDVNSTPQVLKYTTTENATYKNCNWWITYLPEEITTSLDRVGSSGSKSRKVKHEYNVTTGNLIKKTTDIATTNEIITTYSSFDKFGNAKSIKINAKGETQRSSTLAFDNTGRFVTQRKNSSGNIVETIAINQVWGQPQSITDIDGNKTQFAYDNYGRVKSTTDYLNNKTNITYSWNKSNNAQNTGYNIATLYKVSTSRPNAPNSVNYFDKFGREVLSSSQKFGTTNLVYSYSKFDKRGRKTDESAPFYISSNKEVTVTKLIYDYLSRVKKSETYIFNNKGTNTTNVINYAYPIRMVEVSGTNIIDKTTTIDVTGKVITVTDPGGTLHYTYNNFNELFQVKDGQGNILTENQYDNFGRQKQLTDINAGKTTYTYSPFDELKSQTDAKGNTTTMTYDNLGRMKTKKLADANGGVINYTYAYNTATQNGALLLKSESGPNGNSTAYTYDSRGRLKDKTDKISGINFKTSHTYDGFGNIKSIAYPNNLTVSYTYDTVTGDLKKATANNTTVYELTGTNHLGQITDYKYSGGTIPVKHTFDEFGMPTSTKAKNGALFHWEYEFDKANGNLKRRYNVKNSRTESFKYDALHRLTHVNNTLAVQYRTNGNISSKQDAGDYTYNESKINAVTGISNTKNAISLLTEEISYTAFDRPKTIKEGAVSYELFYGPQHDRKKTVSKVNGQTTTRYYSGNFERVDDPSGKVTSIYYLSFVNAVDVIFVKEGQNDNPGQTTDQIYYTFTDYLGSILKVVDANGNTKEEQSFDAWGRKRNPANWQVYDTPAQAQPKTLSWLNRGYTGHEHLYQFGLINMNNRLYDPVVGRMLAVDNFVGDAESTQAYNRYSYANNNPLKYIDPSGEVAHLIVGAVIGGLVNWAMNGAQFNLQGLGYFAVGALAGALTAGVASSMTAAMGSLGFITGAATGSVTGLVGGFANGFGNSLVSGDSFGDAFDNGIRSAATGAALGGITGGISGGIRASKIGLDFWNGDIVKNADKLQSFLGGFDFADNATASSSTMISEGTSLSQFRADLTSNDAARQYIIALKKGYIYGATGRDVTMSDLFDFTDLNNLTEYGWVSAKQSAGGANFILNAKANNVGGMSVSFPQNYDVYKYKKVYVVGKRGKMVNNIVNGKRGMIENSIGLHFDGPISYIAFDKRSGYDFVWNWVTTVKYR